MKKKLWYTLGILLVLLLAAIIFLGTTTSGLRISVALANRFAPGEITAGKLQGNLFYHLQLKDFTYQSPDLTIDIKSLDGQWALPLLLFNHLKISQLHADGIHIITKTSKSDKQSKNNPPTDSEFSLPITMNIEDVSLKNIHFQQDNSQTIKIRNILLKVKSTNNDIHFRDFVVDSKTIRVEVHGKLAMNKKAQTNLLGEITNYQNTDLNNHFSANGDLNDAIRLTISSDTPSLFTINAGIEKPLTTGLLKVQGDWKKIAWPRKNNPAIVLANGHFKIAGSFAHYTITGHSQFYSEETPTLNLHFSGNGDKQSIQFKKIELQAAKSHALFQGKIRWQPHAQWQISLKSSHFNTNIFMPKTNSDINIDLVTDGNLADQHHYGVIQLKRLSGNYNHMRIHGGADILYRDGNISVKQLQLQIGANTLMAAGNLDKQSNFKWSIDARNLHQVHPLLQGSLFSVGRLSNNYWRPKVITNTTIDTLRSPQLDIKHLQLNTDFDSSLNSSLNAKLEANHIHWQQLNMLNTTLAITGNNKKHSLLFLSNINREQIYLQLFGHISANSIEETINHIGVQSAKIADWHLVNPAKLSISKTGIALTDLNWQSQQQQMKFNLNYDTAKNWKSQVTLHDVNFAFLNNFLQTPYKFKSDISGTLSASGKGNQHNQATLKLDNKLFTINYHYRDQNKNFTLLNSPIIASFSQKHGLEVNANLQLTKDKLPLTINFSLPDLNPYDFKWHQAINGAIKFNWKNISLLQHAIPAISSLSGSATGNVTINGKLKAPNFSGNTAIHNMNIGLEEYGLNLKNMNLQGKFTQNQVRFNGNGASQGKFSISGHCNIDNPLSDTSIQLQGNNIQVINTNHYKVSISPNVTLTYSHKKNTLNGSLGIPTANLRPQDFSSTVTLPDSFVIIDNTQQQNTLATPLQMNLSVTLGKDVGAFYRGLTVKTAGKLHINKKVNGKIYGNGNITVTRGQYRAYGKDLSINKGQINFNRSLINDPSLNILATSKIPIIGYSIQSGLNNITVGVRITGSAQNPIITLYSQPQMSQTNILSYLLFGRPSDDQGSNGDMLATALAALASGEDDGGFFVKTQQSLGLSTFGFQTGQLYTPDSISPQTTQSFVIGKKITDDIEALYSIGLNVPVNVITLRYNISHQWQLQFQNSSYDSGGDLIYTIETD